MCQIQFPMKNALFLLLYIFEPSLSPSSACSLSHAYKSRQTALNCSWASSQTNILLSLLSFLPLSRSSADSTVWDPEGDTSRPEQLTSSPASTSTDWLTRDWVGGWITGCLNTIQPEARTESHSPHRPADCAWLRGRMDDEFNSSAQLTVLVLHLLTEFGSKWLNKKTDQPTDPLNNC